MIFYGTSLSQEDYENFEIIIRHFANGKLYFCYSDIIKNENRENEHKADVKRFIEDMYKNMEIDIDVYTLKEVGKIKENVKIIAEWEK